MMKKILVLSCLFASLNVQAQHADARISQLMNESRWFDLAQELKTTPADSVTPWVRQMGVAMTHYFFNRPDSACMVLTDLLGKHQQELGDHTLNMVVLLAVNLGRTEQYADAAGLIRNLCDQLGALGMDSTQTAPYRMLASQYGILASCGPVCQPLHKAGEYRFPMVTEHETDQHFIEMDGSINGQAGRMVLDTGAGSNMLTPEQAEKYGLRRLGMDVTVGGIGGMKQGYYAMADTLRIGGMAWINVPFYVVDLQTGHAEADRLGKDLQLPPVVGLPILLRMQEIQLDFARREFVIPAVPTPSPLRESNMIRTDSECLQVKVADETGAPLYFHFDTGSYYTNMQPAWYGRHRKEVEAVGIPDSLRQAGIGGVSITRSYILPQKKFRIGSGTAVLDSVGVNTGIDLHTGQLDKAAFSNGQEDGFLGLNLLEKFSKVIINLKDMYLEAIPYTDK